MNKEEVVASYKSLGKVEAAFRALKTTSLEMRPVHHKTDDRIRAHIFICMLAYYLQWHIQKRLKPLFDENKEGQHRENSFRVIIEKLKAITICDMKVGDIGIGNNISKPTAQQQKIISLLEKPNVATNSKWKFDFKLLYIKKINSNNSWNIR